MEKAFFFFPISLGMSLGGDHRGDLSVISSAEAEKGVVTNLRARDVMGEVSRLVPMTKRLCVSV